MRYEILLRNKMHDIVIIPYAVVSHIGVDTMLSRVCEANEKERRVFFNRLGVDRRNIFFSPRTPFVLACVTVEKGNVPLSLSPDDFLSYEDIVEDETEEERELANSYLVSKVLQPQRL